MVRIIDGVPHLRVDETALFLRLTRLRVLMLIKEGVLSGTIIDGEWFVARPSVEALSAAGTPPVAGPACQQSCSAKSCGCKG